MTARDLLMTTAGLVAVAAWVLAGTTAWLLVTTPTTVAMAIDGGDGRSLVEAGLRLLYDLVARLVSFF